jgi:hypothetical protein
VLLYWWSGVVLVVTTASTTPAGRRLRLQPRRPCTGGDALVGNCCCAGDDYFILDAGWTVPRTQPRRRPLPLFDYTTVSYSPSLSVFSMAMNLLTKNWSVLGLIIAYAWECYSWAI